MLPPSPRPPPARGGGEENLLPLPLREGVGGRGPMISDEHLRPVHRPPDRHLAAGDRDPAGRRPWLSRAARLRPAGSRLPHHPGHHPASRRQPRDGGDPDHRLAGASVRPDPRPGHDDLAEFRGHQPDHPAIRPQPQHGFRRAGRAGRDQRRRRHAAGEPSVPSGLCQGEPGRCADPDAGADLRTHCRSTWSATPPIHCCSRNCPRSTASAGSPCRADCARRCACASIPPASPPTAWPWRTCAPPSPMPT